MPLYALPRFRAAFSQNAILIAFSLCIINLVFPFRARDCFFDFWLIVGRRCVTRDVTVRLFFTSTWERREKKKEITKEGKRSVWLRDPRARTSANERTPPTREILSRPYWNNSRIPRGHRLRVLRSPGLVRERGHPRRYVAQIRRSRFHETWSRRLSRLRLSLSLFERVPRFFVT